MKEIITLSERINHTKYNLVYPTLNDVVQNIRDGNMILHDKEFGRYSLRQAIEYIRGVNADDMQNWKLRLLPAIAYNGKFMELNGAGLVEYSCITALDFDHIATLDDMVNLRNRLMKTPCVRHVFTTPSGWGLKALVLHDNTNQSRHRDLYEQLLNKFYVASSDPSCKDLARRNYLSYDPDIWTNPNPKPFHYIPSIKLDIKAVITYRERKVSDKSIISIMNSIWKKKNPEYWKEGKRAFSVFMLACLMCKWGVDENLAVEYFVGGWESVTMSGEEIQSHVRNAYRVEKNNFGTLSFKVY